ncbi:type I-C CRISPR-associated endonuclease Cas1c [Pseudobacteroides cellulosolvens]|uniref:CRISPR-associated endonuclease Cas1 n=1 Tax=Pseudobacteroides cellulosolvens ATCC 35603 = DSM 2933 TaxID=398512 RepID=A0A0L6JNM6_9FIRM|nr:type I-C CRISPR-associated endonuclease Cas1c [Pseudobacteroides cellulosolvens]KNY27426.1 CRISPR-associated protein Cas1 [Pseudobacteroides cellulosolvens ATCC 35603 = DSM 2933]
MRRLLNTLYVTTPDAYLACEGENVLVKADDQTKFRIPIHNLEGIITFGYAGASPALMRLCCERGVAFSFLSSSGYFLGRVTGKAHGNVLLRRQQYRWADNDETTLRLSKRFIVSKILNSRVCIQRALRDHEEKIESNELVSAVNILKRLAEEVRNVNNIDLLRGIEGEAARIYFGCLDTMILAQKDEFFFHERIKRPPTDNVNALLSFLYTILSHDVEAALESVGLDPQVGYLHRDRPGRSSLALDMMEEFRSYLVDRMVLSLINRRQINGKGFIKKESEAVIMTDETKKLVLTEWQKRKKEEITHPYLDEKIPIGLLPYAQALLMARHIRGDLDDYPPFFWK